MAGDFVKWSGACDHPPDIAQCEVINVTDTSREEPVQQIYNAQCLRFHSVKHGLYFIIKGICLHNKKILYFKPSILCN